MVPMLIFGLLFATFVYVHQDYRAAMFTSRLDLLHALVREGTVTIDAYHENTTDKAVYDGRYYSDKPPGTALAALPAFSVGWAILHWNGRNLDTPASWQALSWMATAGSVGWITALGGVFCFRWLRFFVDTRWAVLTTLAVFLGSMPFPNATCLMPHGMTTGLLFIALWTVTPMMLREDFVGSPRKFLLAGFCLGWILASEFTAGLMVLGIGFLVIVEAKRRNMPKDSCTEPPQPRSPGEGIEQKLGRWSRKFHHAFCHAGRWLVLGALPALATIPVYSWLCLGDPFVLPYSHQASFPEMEQGLYAIHWPDLENGLRLLFGPTRGLFFWSPFLLMAVLGYAKLRRIHPSLFWACWILPVLQVVVISGRVWDWPAGWTIGPRYLSPILPFLALPAALAMRRFPAAGLITIAASFCLTGLGTIVDGTPTYQYEVPWFELHLPKLSRGDLVDNLGHLMGLTGLWSLAPLGLIFLVYGGSLRYAVQSNNTSQSTQQGI